MSWQLQLGRPALRMDTLGFEPRAFRMRCGCDATAPCAPCRHTCSCMLMEHRHWPRCPSAVRCHVCSQRWYWPARWRCPTRMHGSGWCAHSAQRHDHCTQSLSCSIQLSDVAWLQGEKPPLMHTLGFEARAFRMRSGCDATAPCALNAEADSQAIYDGMPVRVVHVCAWG